MGDSEGAAATPIPTTVAGLEESFFERQRSEHLLNAMNARAHGLGADSNLNYEEEIPGWNPNMPKEMAPPSYLTAEVRDRDGGRGFEGGIPDAAANLAEVMPELYISDPGAGLRQATSRSRVGLPPAGISSNARHYKMASDIFGTGMDRTWSAGEAPPRPIHSFVPKQPQSGKERNSMDSRSVKQLEESMMGPPMARNRNEPASFKITETASDNSGEPAEDFAIGSPAARKARESSGNPLTGQGYSDASTKTAKRYYGGSNANQKLW